MKVAGSHTQLKPLDVVRESIPSEDRGVDRGSGRAARRVAGARSQDTGLSHRLPTLQHQAVLVPGPRLLF